MRRRRGRQSIEILVSNGKTCPYCAVIMRVYRSLQQKQRNDAPNFPTRDHVIPRSRMPGQGTIIVCRKCNGDKGDRTLPEWLVVLVEAGDPRVDHVKKFMNENAAAKQKRPSLKERK